MLCDKYKEALIEAAGSGAALPNALSEHVEACAICGARLAAERTLFAAIDGGLHKAANAKLRSALLPNVKARLATETVSVRSPIPGWALVCATGALAVAVTFLNVPRGARDRAQRDAVAVSTKVPAKPRGAGLSVAPERKIRITAGAFKAPEQQDLSVAARREPEVLIQTEEDEYLKRFYAAARTPAIEVRKIVTDEHEIMPKPQFIAQIELEDLTIEELDDESGLIQSDTK